jgi:hypothetical protein
MFSTKFWLTFWLTVIALVLSYAAYSGFSIGSFRDWFWGIWLWVLWVALGLDFGLVIFIGWDYLNPTESRLPFYAALGASLILVLIYLGFSSLMRYIITS